MKLRKKGGQPVVLVIGYRAGLTPVALSQHQREEHAHRQAELFRRHLTQYTAIVVERYRPVGRSGRGRDDREID